MKILHNNFTYECYDELDGLNGADQQLLLRAREVTGTAYAPYSQFQVGAAIRLMNEEIVTGSNQENASFPAGMCAERVALATASSLFPRMPIDTMAISYHNLHGSSNTPVSPCGICRQALCEYENSLEHSIRIILGGLTGKIYIIPAARLLLPLSFSAKDLK
jgi:cytidine deaminase